LSATKRQLTREQLIAGARLGALVGGCTCTPEVRLRELRPGIFVADVAHDPTCGHPSQQKGRDA
jgi:hypothetical protein